jgi:type I restriction enzyme, S subunit
LLVHRTVQEFGSIGPNNKFYKGQILYSKIRPSLSKAVVAPYDGLCSADMYPIKTLVDINFMLKIILSEVFLKQVRQAENQVKMPKLNLESLGVFQIPIPPLVEQRRIVAEIDRLMARCDELEKLRADRSQKQTDLLNALMSQF